MIALTVGSALLAFGCSASPSEHAGAGTERSPGSPAAAADARPLEIRWEGGEGGAPGRVVVGPLPPGRGGDPPSDADLERVLPVWAGASAVSAADGWAPGACEHPESLPPLLGRYRLGDGALIFEPRFAPRPGSVLAACFDPGRARALIPELALSAADATVLQARWTVAGGEAAAEAAGEAADDAPRVLSVWPPDGATVPANLLRVYVHFSEPMSRRGVGAGVRLLDAGGAPIADALVDVPEGLWDPQGRRLTLFLHPGRIKRGVGPRTRLGPVLREGETVRLRVDGAQRSLRGIALGRPFELEWTVGADDRTSPDPAAWTVEPPAGPDSPVVLHFDEALDPEQLRRFATVRGPEGRITGSVGAAATGRRWSFTPAAPWSAGSYRILARRDVEDLAGNSPARLFDRELGSLAEGESPAAPAATGAGDQTLSFRFEVRSPR